MCWSTMATLAPGSRTSLAVAQPPTNALLPSWCGRVDPLRTRKQASQTLRQVPAFLLVGHPHTRPCATTKGMACQSTKRRLAPHRTPHPTARFTHRRLGVTAACPCRSVWSDYCNFDERKGGRGVPKVTLSLADEAKKVAPSSWCPVPIIHHPIFSQLEGLKPTRPVGN